VKSSLGPAPRSSPFSVDPVTAPEVTPNDSERERALELPLPPPGLCYSVEDLRTYTSVRLVAFRVWKITWQGTSSSSSGLGYTTTALKI
jgi:hypothetical protein